MGFLFNAHHWRQPLRMIDRWLSAPPAPVACGLTQPWHPFARAGWLGRSTRATQAPRGMTAVAGNDTRPRRLRLVRTIDGASNSRTDGRLVISGPIGDVCAELDRLAALESGEHRKT